MRLVLNVFVIAGSTLWCGAAVAQSSARPAFIVAKITASPSSDRQSLGGGPGTSSPGQFTCTHMALSDLIAKAWDLQPWQFANPEKAGSAYFNIAAKIPPNTTKHDFNLMLQALLVEHVGLAIHFDPKRIDGFDLVVAKGGVRMFDAEPAPRNEIGPAPNEPLRLIKDKAGRNQLPPGRPKTLRTGLDGVTRIMARMQDLSDVVRVLQDRLRQPVSDKTGLTAKYDYVLEYVPDAPVAPNTSEPAALGPSLEQAVTLQMGLRLVRKKVSVDVLFVDSFSATPLVN